MRFRPNRAWAADLCWSGCRGRRVGLCSFLDHQPCPAAAAPVLVGGRRGGPQFLEPSSDTLAYGALQRCCARPASIRSGRLSGVWRSGAFGAVAGPFPAARGIPVSTGRGIGARFGLGSASSAGRAGYAQVLSSGQFWGEACVPPRLGRRGTRRRRDGLRHELKTGRAKPATAGRGATPANYGRARTSRMAALSHGVMRSARKRDECSRGRRYRASEGMAR